MSGIQYFKNLVEVADNATLLMSRKHCHAKNVSSIVVRNDDGQLTRAFLCWPGHGLFGGHLEVGVHDHLYDIHLVGISGTAYNVLYQESPDGDVFYHWAHRSGVESGAPELRLLGCGHLKQTARKRIRGEFISMCSDQLHTIEAFGVCGWMVQEGRRRKTETTLFTATSTVNTDGLYERFESRDEVVAHVRDWIWEATR